MIVSRWSLVVMLLFAICWPLVVGVASLSCQRPTKNNQRTLSPPLHQPMQFFLIQMFHNFAHILRLLARRDQQRVVRLYHN